ncbi:MAG: cation-translocating P-type ATPase [Eubacteriales bacterium]|nr:cation-translocating P-type ATPase [Eubacteriales bacterium]
MSENYFNMSPEETLRKLQSSQDGLSQAEASERLQKYGKNQLNEARKKSVPEIFISQFADLLVIILIAAAVISFFSGNRESTIVIFAVLILNALLGTVQTVKADKSLESLKAMSAPNSKVIRDGKKLEIPAVEIVPGDVLVLEAGDLVGADARLLSNFSLKVNESSLTGESEAVEKSVSRLEENEVALGDQKNMVFSGSLVTYGRAHAIVTATGMDTQLGKIAALMNQTKQRKTPLQESLDKFSEKLAIGILIISAFVFLLSIFRSHMGILDSLMFAVALAVAAIPEALSSIVTIVLAIGTQKMAKQNAIIKDLKAVESLGCVSVICSDKTGTLTQNRMTVQKLYADGQLLDIGGLDLSNEPQRMLVKIGLLASDATTGGDKTHEIGDPTEIALVRIGDSLEIIEAEYRSQHPRLAEIAFDSDRKLMSTLHLVDSVPTLYTKGAIDTLLGRSDYMLTSAGEVPMTDGLRRQVMETNEALSRQGLRVLAFAERKLPELKPSADGDFSISLDDEYHFTFIGLVSMMDPPREESIQAVADAKRAGIRTIMITGDHKVTASAIAKQIGIFEDGDLAVEGVELERMSEEELAEKLPRISVYARVSPEHKIRIVNAWQHRGCIVSMTGDGVNDAPALKKADIGVAMGITGTDVSKDAASMILADDNFATIVKAVVNGRGVYANIKNTIHFLLSGNMAAILCVLYASLAGLPAPFAPVHLLFINLLTDSLPAIAIGMEPARANLLSQKPRDPKAPILDRELMLRILSQGFLIAIPVMTAFYLGYSRGGNTSSAMTMAFSTLTLARLFHGFNCRGSESIFRLGFLSNPFSLAAFGLGTALLLLVLLVPLFHPLFMVADLSALRLEEIILLALVPTVLIQAARLIRGK